MVFRAHPTASALNSRDIITNTRRLAPEIERRADEIAALRRLPALGIP
jgi:hypothetical protein